jgi:hypothetical protein
VFPLATSYSSIVSHQLEGRGGAGLTLLPSLETPETAPWTVSLMYEAALETLSAIPPVVVVLVVADLYTTASVGYSGRREWGSTHMIWAEVRSG